MENIAVNRGDVWFADLPINNNYVLYGKHPVLVIQNYKGLLHSPTVIVAGITSKLKKQNLPTHVPLDVPFLDISSQVLTETILTLDRSKLKQKMGRIPPEVQKKIDYALAVSIGLK